MMDSFKSSTSYVTSHLWHTTFILLITLVFTLLLCVKQSYSDVNCNFEIDYCDWYDPNGHDWTLVNSSYNIDPGHDHSCQTTFGSIEKKCQWLTTEQPTFDKQDFVLISPVQNGTQKTSCFSFWYHFFGIKKATFDVRINTDRAFGGNIVFARYTPVSNNWAFGYVDIPPSSEPFYLIIHAQLSSKYHDRIGVDDIVFNIDQQCPKTPNCDFESDNMCGWQADSGVNIAHGAPIGTDHTTYASSGHYLLVTGDAHKGSIKQSVEHLIKDFFGNSQFCLKFWYYFQYPEGSFESASYILINETNSFKPIGPNEKQIQIHSVAADGDTNRWRPVFYTISTFLLPTSTTYINITMHTSGQTSVALDDLVIQEGDCESYGNCNFESDMCGWTNEGALLWLRTQASDADNTMKRAPTHDNTTPENTYGWYLVLPAEYLATDDQYYASIESPPIQWHYDTEGCIHFAYFASSSNDTIPVLNVSVIDLSEHRKTLTYAIINSTLYTRWTVFRLNVPRLSSVFSIQIHTLDSVIGFKSDIALDDIRFVSGSCDNAPKITTPKPTPIPDQELKWDCTFDDNYHCPGWQWDSNFWSSTSYRKLPPTVDGPRTDKTEDTPDGGYLFYMPNANAVPVSHNSTTLITTINSTFLTIKQHCLTFWYFDSSESLFELRVHIVSTIKTRFNTLFHTIRPNVASRMWKMFQQNIDVNYQGENIQLEFRAEKQVNTSFAIDDIRLYPNECDHSNGYTYDFDYGLDDLELAHIMPLNDYMGIVHAYGVVQYPYAPKNDHTTGDGGYFLFMNDEKQFHTSYEDWLIVTNLPANDNYRQCVIFAYQIYGNASLQLYQQTYSSNLINGELFRAYDDHRKWVIGQVVYDAQERHKLVFVMTKEYDLFSYVALDDIRLENVHNCKEEFDCDFDYDVCSFWSVFDEKLDYYFARFIAPPTTAIWPGPSYDHTKRGYGGGYLYMTGYPSNESFDRMAQIQTPIGTYKNINQCLSFFTQLTNTDAILNFWLVLYDDGSSSNSTKWIQLLSLNDTKESKWTRHYVGIDGELFKSFNEYNIVIEGRTREASTVIAIDDVQMYYTELCDNVVKFKCKNGEQIDSDLVCDFHPNCKDGTDEINCGNCDFESNTCGWINQTRSKMTELTQGMWVMMSTGAKTDGNGRPTVDGSNNATGHYLMLEPYPNSETSFISYTKLTRKYQVYEQTLKDAYLTCTMTFQYYIQVSNATGAYAQIRVLVGADEDSSVVRLILQSASSDYPDGGQPAIVGKWQTQTVFIGSFSGPFVVQFVGTQTVNNDTVIAIDNVKFQNCSLPDPLPVGHDCPNYAMTLCNTTRLCIDTSDLCNFEDNCGDNSDETYTLCAPYLDPLVVPACTFEKSIETCGFINEYSFDDPKTKYHKFGWIISRSYYGKLMTKYNAPGADHTTRDENGQFVILYPRDPVDVGRPIRLISPMMYALDGDCVMRMFYFNNGDESIMARNTLRVWIRHADGNQHDSGILFESHTYVNAWIMAKSRYRSSAPFQFVIEGTIVDMHSSISLDDISFTDTCQKSNAIYSTSTTHSFVIVIVAVIIVLLVLTLFAIGGYIAWRKHLHRQLN